MNITVPATLSAILGIFWAVRVPVEQGLYAQGIAFGEAFVVVFIVMLFVSFLISVFFARQMN